MVSSVGLKRTRIPVWKDSDAILDIANYLREHNKEKYRPIELVDLSSNIFRSERKKNRYSTTMMMVGLLRMCKGINLIAQWSGIEGGKKITKYYYQSTCGDKFNKIQNN